jgi:hypothetical protein
MRRCLISGGVTATREIAMTELKKVQVKVTENQEWFVEVNVPAHLFNEVDIIEHLQEHESWIYDDMMHKNIDRDIWVDVMPQKVVLTEQQLFEKIHQAFSGTEVTYKQIECELDEQGDITIFFSGLDQGEVNDAA